MTKKWNMIIDVARCHNARNCFLAVKDEHIGNEFPGYAAPQPLHGHSWVDIKSKERGQWPMTEANFMPVMCNHCDNAPCIKAANNHGVRKRSDGIVIIDPVKAKGQKQLVKECPYGAIYWNEELEVPQAWIFDAHLLDSGWKRTRIEQVCASGVFKSLKVEDGEMQNIAESNGLETIHPEWGTRPRVYYKNLHLFNKCFVGGSIAADIEGREECVSNVPVTLSKGTQTIASAFTDAFGDFKFDKLEGSSEVYKIRIEAAGYHARDIDIQVSQSTYIGTLKLIDCRTTSAGYEAEKGADRIV